MLSEKEKQLLKELQAAHIDFMIVGLSAAVLQYAPVVTQDVDLWLRNVDDPKISECCKRVGGIFLPLNLNFQMPARFAGESFENLDIVIGLSGIGSFDQEYKEAIDIQIAEDLVVKVLPLEKIIASKEAAGREKDKIVMPALKSASIRLLRNLTA